MDEEVEGGGSGTSSSLFSSPASSSAVIGVPKLQFIPRCAVLARYGGGNDLRLGESLLSLPLDAAAAIPTSLKGAIVRAVEAAVGKRNAGLFEKFAVEHVRDTPFPHGGAGVQWDAALAVSTTPSKDWANIWFHGWLFSSAVEEVTARGCKLESEGDASQRYPLVGIFEHASLESSSRGFAPFCSSDEAFLREGGGATDVRAAGWGGRSCTSRPAHTQSRRLCRGISRRYDRSLHGDGNEPGGRRGCGRIFRSRVQPVPYGV